MKIDFNVKPYQGCMDVKIVYEREEINQEYFYLNRDFVITHCLTDGTKYDITNDVEMVSFDDFSGYETKKYFIPQFDKQLTLEYTGVLSGKTGCCPYVRKQYHPTLHLYVGKHFVILCLSMKM